MKHIKKIAFMILVVAFAMPAFQSCKKGENDPFLSIKSRKARLKGEWNLAARSETSVSGTTSTTYTYNGSMMTVMSGGSSSTYVYSEKITINADGTFTIEQTSNSGGTSTNSTVKGNWWFGKKNKAADYKNGEVLILQLTSYMTFGSSTSTVAWTGADCPIINFIIDQLKSKEMIVIEDGRYSYGTSIGSTTGTSTYEKK